MAVSKNTIISSNDVYFSCLFPDEEVTERRIPRHVLIHVKSGKMFVDDHKRHIVVNAGETALIRRNHEVRVSKTGDGGAPYSAVSIIFDRAFLKDFFARIPKTGRMNNDSHRPDSAVVILGKVSRTTDAMAGLEHYISDSELPDEKTAADIKTDIAASLLSEHEELYPVLFDFNEPWKIDIFDFMEKHFVSDLSLAELASYTGRSLAGFKRDFAKISSLSPQKWIIQRRLDEALRLIVKEKMPVTDACFASGFKNRTHFVRAFKERFGVAPSHADMATIYKNDK